MRRRAGLHLLLVGGFLVGAAVLVLVIEIVVRGALLAWLEGAVSPAVLARAIAATRLSILVGAVVVATFVGLAVSRFATSLRQRLLNAPAEAARVARGSAPALAPTRIAELDLLGDSLLRLLEQERELRASATRQLDTVRRDFVANASHELKTPLTSIRGYSETLLEGDVAPGLQREFLATIAANAERLQRIVDDLLDLSRLESGGWRPELQDVDPAAAAADAWSAFRERARGCGVAFSIEDSGAFRVLADPSGLRQIFSNLFDNALRYTPPGGRIAVRIGPSRSGASRRAAGPDARRPDAPADAARVAIEVRDTGAGIPREALPRIFERFYRADPARSRAEGGTGLGLSIVKHLAESMGGDVAAESELGRGTTVRVELSEARAGSEAGGRVT